MSGKSLFRMSLFTTRGPFSNSRNIQSYQSDLLNKLRVIHVGGSNGKGSTCSIVEAILRRLGYRTGFLSSPHLVNIEERIRINNQSLTPDQFSTYFWYIRNHLEKLKDSNRFLQPTYLDYLTVMAFYAFVDQKVDVAIVEVGLGGRYDHTNIVGHPSVCALTSLTTEHTEILGSTLAEIAWAKAGIFKPACPAVVLSGHCQEVMNVLTEEAVKVKIFLSQCAKTDHMCRFSLHQCDHRSQAPFYIAHNDLLCDDASYSALSSRSTTARTDNIHLGLAIVQLWLQRLYDNCLLEPAASHSTWPGRWQKATRAGVNFYLDSAHTPDSMQKHIQPSFDFVYFPESLTDDQMLSFYNSLNFIKMNESLSIHTGIAVEMSPVRMLHLTRLCPSLPAFPTEAIRLSQSPPSIRFFDDQWLVIVVGSELFVWRYDQSRKTSQSCCIRLDLPPSDVPIDARLVGISSSDSSPLGCLALTPYGGLLRLWPRLAHGGSHHHSDVTLSSGPLCGLYAEEAVQLESIVSNVYLVATRPGNLVLLDARRNGQEILCRVLTTSTTGSDEGGGFISGLSRRMSTLIRHVVSSPSGLLQSPAGSCRSSDQDSSSFVRMATTATARSSQQPHRLCRIYVLTNRHLAVWTLDDELNEHLHQTVSIASLIGQSSASQYNARGIDLALQSIDQDDIASSYDDLFILLTSSSNLNGTPLALLQLRFHVTDDDDDPTICIASTSLVDLTWSFHSPASANLHSKHLHPTSQALKLCSPFARSSSACTAFYPCPLIGVSSLSTGHVALYDPLTGINVAGLAFGQSCLLGVGGCDGGSDHVGDDEISPTPLFTFITGQKGVLGLVPSSITTGGCGFNSLTPQASSKKPTITNKPVSMSVLVSKDDDSAIEIDLHVKPLLSSSTIGSPSLQFDFTSSGLITDADKCFTILCQAARIYWMDYKQHATAYLMALASTPAYNSHLTQAFLRLTRRILVEPPLSDTRLTSASNSTPRRQRTLSKSSVKPLLPCMEGCLDFPYVLGNQPTTSSTSPISLQLRFGAKIDSISRLRDLWLTLCRLQVTANNYLVPLIDPVSFFDPYCDRGGDGRSHVRQYAGEQMPCEENDSDGEPHSLFACQLEGSDNSVESCAAELLTGVDRRRALQASSDLGELVGATSHLACEFRLASELIEFSRGLYASLVRESVTSDLEPFFNSIITDADFAPQLTKLITPQELVMQTLVLIPNLIRALIDQLEKEGGEYSSSASGGDTEQSPDQLARRLIGLVDVTSRLVLAGLQGVLQAREEQLQSTFAAIHSNVEGVMKTTVYLPCWFTDSHGMGDQLLCLFDWLIRLLRGQLSRPGHRPSLSGDEAEQREASNRVIELASCILTLARQRLKWTEESSRWAWTSLQDSNDSLLMGGSSRLATVQRLRRLRYWYANLRSRLISAIADDLGRLDAALGLAEQFADCSQLVRLCYLLEVSDAKAAEIDTVEERFEYKKVAEGEEFDQWHHHRLLPLLKRAPPDWHLADRALQWYFDQGEHARVQSLIALLDLEQLSTSRDKDNNHEWTTATQPMQVESSYRHDEEPAFLSPAPPIPQVRSTPVANSQKQQSSRPANVSSFASPGVSIKDSGRAVGDVIGRFLDRHDTQDYAWPHLLSKGQYSKAARVLFDQACKERRFLGRRKTLFSLAKLACLTETEAAESGSMMAMEDQRDAFLTKLNLLLEHIHIQELLPRELLESSSELGVESPIDSSTNPSHWPVLDADSLARLYVSYSAEAFSSSNLLGDRLDHSVVNGQGDLDSTNGNDDDTALICSFIRALRLAKLLPRIDDCFSSSSQQQYLKMSVVEEDVELKQNRLLLHIWCQAIKMDRWPTQPTSEDPVVLCGRSFVCTLLKELNQQASNASQLLPDSTSLLEAFSQDTNGLREDQELASNPHFRHLIATGLEYARVRLSAPMSS